ncbi:MAG: hypothetical protein ABSH41_09365 [Syntrophobacteraceae bacterium]
MEKGNAMALSASIDQWALFDLAFGVGWALALCLTTMGTGLSDSRFPSR